MQFGTFSTEYNQMCLNACIFLCNCRHLKGRVFVGLANGTVAVFRRDTSKLFPFFPSLQFFHHAHAFKIIQLKEQT